MSKQKQQFTGNARQLLAEIEKIRKSNIKLEEQMSKMTSTSRRGFDGTNKRLDRQFKLIDGTIKKVASLALGYIGLQSAIQGAINLIREKNELEDKSKEVTLSVADTQAEIATRLHTGEDFNKFLKDLKKVARDQKFGSIADLNKAAAETLTAVEGRGTKTLEILKSTAAYFRHKPGELGDFSAAIGDINKQTKGNIDDDIGLALGGLRLARTTNLANVAEIASTIQNAGVTTSERQRHETAAEATALFGAVSSRTSDDDGAVTRTAIINYARKLKEMFPDIDSLKGRQEAARDLPEVEKKELLKSGFRAKTVGIIEELISKDDNETKMLLRQGRKQLADKKFLSEGVDVILSRLEGTGELKQANLKRTSDLSFEDFSTSSEASLISQARDVYKRGLEAKRRDSNFFTNAYSKALGATSVAVEWGTSQFTGDENENVDTVNRMLGHLLNERSLVSQRGSNYNQEEKRRALVTIDDQMSVLKDIRSELRSRRKTVRGESN